MALKMAGKKKLKYKYKVKSPHKPQVVFGNGDVPKNTDLVAFDHVQKENRKKVLLKASVVVVVLIAGTLLVSLIAHNHANAQKRDDLVSQAVPLLTSYHIDELATVVAQIKQQPGYAKDVDCLYVLTTYYINASDVTNAKLYYSELSKVYNQKTGYRNAGLKDANTPEQLSSRVSFIEKQASEESLHFIGIPSP